LIINYLAVQKLSGFLMGDIHTFLRIPGFTIFSSSQSTFVWLKSPAACNPYPKHSSNIASFG